MHNVSPEMRKTIKKHFRHEREQFDKLARVTAGLTDEDEELPDYVHKDFPAHRYNAAGQTALVNSPEQDSALGDGWYKSPADVPAPAEKTSKRS